MAKPRKKKRAPRPRHEPGRQPSVLDVTPERLAKGDDHDFVNPALIDPRQPIGRVRRFRVSALDRLLRRGKIAWPLWYAGDCYRTAWHRAAIAINVVASYGEVTSRSEPSHGLPRTMAQLKARRFVRAMREQVPPDLRQLIDGLLIEDRLPAWSGRRAERQLDEVRAGLEAMARWLRLDVAA